ncbi:MAG TPA: hypothetical protein VN577_19200 [Terriglobales bacterium]|nr:hypothetical protein [Terriglobales bacterium]
MSEASFRKEYSLIWMIAGAGCVILGQLIAPSIVRAYGSWMTNVVALAVYLISILLCQLALPSIWRRPHVTPPILFFSLPVGALCIVGVLAMNWLGPELQIGRRTLGCLALSLGLLYVASLIWAVGVGIRRKKMGDMDTGIS